MISVFSGESCSVTILQGVCIGLKPCNLSSESVDLLEVQGRADPITCGLNCSDFCLKGIDLALKH